MQNCPKMTENERLPLNFRKVLCKQKSGLLQIQTHTLLFIALDFKVLKFKILMARKLLVIRASNKAANNVS